MSKNWHGFGLSDEGQKLIDRLRVNKVALNKKIPAWAIPAYLFNRFTNIRGTANRLEFALVIIFPLAVNFVVQVAVAVWSEIHHFFAPINLDGFYACIFIYYLVFGLTALVRRLHDLGHPGIFAILLFVPVINFFVGLYLFLQVGKTENNPYLLASNERKDFVDSEPDIVLPFIRAIENGEYDKPQLAKKFRLALIKQRDASVISREQYLTISNALTDRQMKKENGGSLNV